MRSNRIQLSVRIGSVHGDRQNRGEQKVEGKGAESDGHRVRSTRVPYVSIRSSAVLRGRPARFTSRRTARQGETRAVSGLLEQNQSPT
jgi:hypothetical protein